MPTVSVIIPVYNQEEYIDEAVQSALNQTFRDLEVIVVNDGSTDGTAARLAKYGRRIRLFHKPNGGTPNALNFGIAQALGRYIAWLSADDVFLPNKLQLQMHAMARRPQAGMCYTDWFIIDGQGRITGQAGSPTFPSREAAVDTLLQCCCINGSTTLIARSALDRTGYFNEAYRQAHDYDLWLRLALYYEFVHVPFPLVKYRWHGRNLSAQPDALAYNAEILANARRMHGR